jgi:hypothetical protein
MKRKLLTLRSIRTTAARRITCALCVALLAGACASLPAGSAPTVEVLPGGGKDMAEFNKDDIACRTSAQAQANGNGPLPTAMGLGRSDIVASARGRLTLRENTESNTGSVFGGAPAADSGKLNGQQRYDTAYVQCMFSKGHKVPLKEQMSS